MVLVDRRVLAQPRRVSERRPIAGKVYYLGELYVDLDCRSFSLRVNDQRQRDSALFDERMTTLKSSLFEYRLLGAR